MVEGYSVEAFLKATGTDQFIKSFQNADKETSKFRKGVDKVKSGLKTFAKAAGVAAAAGTGIFAMANKVTSSFDDIHKGAQRAGVSTDFYQEMDYWASQNGISHEQMEKAVGRFNQRLGQAQNGNDKYNSALQQMGVDMEAVRNGTLSTEDAFAQSISTLSEMESEQDKVNLATEMFGTRMARDLLPALNDGSLSMEEARKKAEELGIVIGEDQIEAGAKFQDTWDDLKRSASAAGQQLMTQVIPTFQSMMDWVIANMPQIQAVFQTVFSVIGTVISTGIEWVKMFIGWIQTWWESNQETLVGIYESFVEYLTMIWEYFQQIWTTLKEFWDEYGTQLMESFMTIFSSIFDTVKTAFENVRDTIQTVLDLVLPWVQEKLEMLMEFWAKNGDQIMQAVQNAFSFIQGVIQTVMPIVQNIIKVAWGFIQTIFDTAIGIVMGIVKTFSSLLTGDFEGIKEGLTTIVTSLWDGIKGIFSNAWSMISEPLSSLWDNITGWFGDMKDSFLDAGKGFIDQMVKGIKAVASKPVDAVKGLAKKVRGFLPFSPAKEGPLSDLDKLDFGGPIVDSVDKAKRGVEKSATNLASIARKSLEGSMDLPNVNRQVASINRQANRSLTNSLNAELNVNKQPANLTFTMFGQTFRAFVEDIFDEREIQVELEDGWA